MMVSIGRIRSLNGKIDDSEQNIKMKLYDCSIAGEVRLLKVTTIPLFLLKSKT